MNTEQKLLLGTDTVKSKTYHVKNMSQTSTNNPHTTSIDNMASIAGQISDKLVGKNMSVTYEFQRLTIDIPRAEAPGGKHLGSVQWTINGKVVITTEAHDKNIKHKTAL